MSLPDTASENGPAVHEDDQDHDPVQAPGVPTPTDQPATGDHLVVLHEAGLPTGQHGHGDVPLRGVDAGRGPGSTPADGGLHPTLTRRRPLLGTTMRACGYPGCPDELDMAAVMSGTAPPRGWMRNRLVEYMCQPHAAGVHVPAWEVDRSTDPPRAIPTCSCGWAGDPARNLAGAAEQWRTHVPGHMDQVEAYALGRP